MGHLTVADASSAASSSSGQAEGVAVDYACVARARVRALRAYAIIGEEGVDHEQRIAGLERGVRELSGAVEDLVAVLTEVVAGFGAGAVHVVNAPASHPPTQGPAE